MSNSSYEHDWQQTNLVPGQLTTCRRCGSLRILGHDHKMRYWTAGQVTDAGQTHPPHCKIIATRLKWKPVQALINCFKWFSLVYVR